jgi:hypothetical protein
MVEDGTGTVKGYEVDFELAKYVDDPKGLRNEMKEVDCVATGRWLTFVLAKRKVPDGATLALVVQGRQNEDRLVRYLMEKEGYVEDRYGLDWTGGRKESQPFWRTWFSRPKVDKKKNVSVTRMECNQPISVESVMQFAVWNSHCTASMNFMTWNKVYVGFPEMTLERREWLYLPCDHVNCQREAVRLNYINNWLKFGWKLVGIVEPGEVMKSEWMKEMTVKGHTSGLREVLHLDEEKDCWQEVRTVALRTKE